MSTRKITFGANVAGILLATFACFASAVTPAVAQSAPKKVLLIGATANSAPTFFRQALNLGYEVSGIARRPEAVVVRDERLTIFKGDVYDQKSIENALTGNEVVVSYLAYSTPGGSHGEILEEIDLFSRGINNVIRAMKNKGNRRLIAVSTTAVERVYVDKPADDAPMVDRLMWNGRRKNDDVRRMEVIIVASGLEYIIVRPARVTGDVSPGTPVNIVVNKNTYAPYKRTLSRPDLAAFILGQLESDEYTGSVIGVYN